MLPGDWLVLLTLWLMCVLVCPLLRLQLSLQRSQLTFNRGGESLENRGWQVGTISDASGESPRANLYQGQNSQFRGTPRCMERSGPKPGSVLMSPLSCLH